MPVVRTIKALERRLQIEGALDVYVQVNSSAEPSKFGLEPAAVPNFVLELPVFSSLRVRGLMTLAIFSSNEARVRACFRVLRRLQSRLRQERPAQFDWHELSMGMASAYEAAIGEGATVVRVGQAIFGLRTLPNSH